MVFITLGTQKFQFNRLLKEIDQLVERRIIEENVFAQIGYSDYIPQHYDFKRFLDQEMFSDFQEQSNLIITHGGTGSIINAIKKGKKVIAVPRLARYKEHVDDHQVQIIKHFHDQNLIYGAMDCGELSNAIIKIHMYTFHKYQSNTRKYIEAISAFLERLEDI